MDKQKQVETLVEQQKMLEHQIHVYRDDFKHETQDKQRAMEENNELKERIRKLENLVGV